MPDVAEDVVEETYNLEYENDMPVTKKDWDSETKVKMKDIIATQVFRRVKFVEEKKDIMLSPYMDKIFIKLGMGNKTDVVQKHYRATHWDSIADYAKDQINALRNKMVATFKKYIDSK
jgi:hypothetical protein